MNAAHQYSVQHQATKRQEGGKAGVFLKSNIPRLTIALLIYSLPSSAASVCLDMRKKWTGSRAPILSAPSHSHCCMSAVHSFISSHHNMSVSPSSVLLRLSGPSLSALPHPFFFFPPTLSPGGLWQEP